MNKRKLLSFVASVVLTGAPVLVEAAQIAPNPNPVGSTIDIINDPTAFNNVNPFNNSGLINIDSSSTFTNSIGANLQNTGLGTLTNAGSVNNYGAISGNVTSSGTINNYGALGGLSPVMLVNSVGGTVNNYGGITTSPFGGFISNAGTLNNFAGGGIVAGFTGGGIGNTGTLNNFAGASIFMSDNSFGNGAGAVLNNAGTMNLSAANSFTNNGIFINSGSFRCCGGPAPGFIFANSAGATMINSGVIHAGTHNFGFGNSGTLINAGSITGLSYDLSSNVLINSGTIDQVRSFASSGLTINNGTITADSATISGILSGTGTVNAPVTIATGALLAPGDATTLGKFTIHGNLESSGDVLFRIQGLSVGQFDVLDISDTATFTGGTMSFAFSGFDPKIGNSWDFLYASAISGWDSLTFLFSGLDSTERAQFHYHNGIQTLRIVAVPEPDSFLLLACGLALLAGWRWKQQVGAICCQR